MSGPTNKDNLRKEGKISYTEKTVAANQTVNILNGIKQNRVEMVRIAIDKRTSIELPASLTQDERDERVAIYIRTHNLK
ncbi:MAG: hypothetical protein RIS29_2933 [Bacteroidota bacterium]|jgi:hypothetical protein